MEADLDLVFSVQFVIVQCILGNPCTSLVHVLHESNIPFCRNETNFLKICVPIRQLVPKAKSGVTRRNWENKATSWSLVTFSGRFCKKRILFGGRYSSGICTFGRFGAGAVAAPSTNSKNVRKSTRAFS
jgi:hypothetical protein